MLLLGSTLWVALELLTGRMLPLTGVLSRPLSRSGTERDIPLIIPPLPFLLQPPPIPPWMAEATQSPQVRFMHPGTPSPACGSAWDPQGRGRWVVAGSEVRTSDTSERLFLQGLEPGIAGDRDGTWPRKPTAEGRIVPAGPA